MNQIAYEAHKNKSINEGYYRKNADDLWNAANQLFASIVYPELSNRDYLEELLAEHTRQEEEHA